MQVEMALAETQANVARVWENIMEMHMTSREEAVRELKETLMVRTGGLAHQTQDDQRLSLARGQSHEVTQGKSRRCPACGQEGHIAKRCPCWVPTSSQRDLN